MSIKAAFKSRPGDMLIEVDYSQMEVACLAAASRDPTLIEEVAAGVDMHTKNAARWRKCAEADVTKKDRKTAKIMTFQLSYGAGAKRIAQDFGLPLAETQAFIDSFTDKYSGVAEWWEACNTTVNRDLQPHAIFMEPDPEYRSNMVLPYGKRYTFIGQYKKQRYKGDALVSVGPQYIKNYPIQGLAADILKMAQASLWRSRGELLRRGVVPSIQIHDSLYFRAKEEVDLAELLKLLKHHMLDYPVQRINELAGMEWWPEALPLRIDMKIGQRWSNMREYK